MIRRFFLFVLIVPSLLAGPFTLSEANLENEKWVEEEAGLGYIEAQFLKGNNFVLEYGSAGDPPQVFKGKYKISGSTIRVYDVTVAMGEGPTEKSADITCKLKERKGQIDYLQKIVCKNDDYSDFEIIPSSSKIEAGTEIKIGKLKAVAMGAATMKATTNVKIRSRPGLKGKTLKTYYENQSTDSGDPYQPRPYLPKGMSVKVFARTPNKEKVQKWNNYWYYIEFIGGRGDKLEGIKKKGWVFGEFLK